MLLSVEDQISCAAVFLEIRFCYELNCGAQRAMIYDCYVGSVTLGNVWVHTERPPPSQWLLIPWHHVGARPRPSATTITTLLRLSGHMNHITQYAHGSTAINQTMSRNDPGINNATISLVLLVSSSHSDITPFCRFAACRCFGVSVMLSGTVEWKTSSNISYIAKQIYKVLEHRLCWPHTSLDFC